MSSRCLRWRLVEPGWLLVSHAIRRSHVAEARNRKALTLAFSRPYRAGMSATDWNHPYTTSTIGWVAPCTTEGHEHRLVADVYVTTTSGGTTLRLCKECQSGLMVSLRNSIPKDV